MEPSGLESIATAVAAGLSLVGLILTWILARRADESAQAAQRLSGLSALQDWRRDLRTWAAGAIDVLSELEYDFRAGRGAGHEVARRCVARLSALVDRGRYFLPNQDRDAQGLDDPPAYRGFRHAALDPLIAALRVGEGSLTGRSDSPADAVCAMRRRFVSLTQSIVDPHQQNAEIASLIVASHRDRPADPTLGGLLPSDSMIPPGAKALLSREPARVGNREP